jgi:hypothetical protein
MQLHKLQFAAAVLATLATAHPGHHGEVGSSELARRSMLAKRCAVQAGQFREKRIKRAAEKRSIVPRDTTVTVHAEDPFYTTIQNSTCVLVPEVTKGPYVWPQSQTLRQDMSENEPGVPLYLDIGVLNLNTCEPLEGALVDLWHCNAVS